MSVWALSKAPVGTALYVVSVGDAGAITDRLVEFGLTHGARVEVLRRAPFSGPLLLRVRDFVLTMRPDAAAAVQVEAARD